MNLHDLPVSPHCIKRPAIHLPEQRFKYNTPNPACRPAHIKAAGRVNDGDVVATIPALRAKIVPSAGPPARVMRFDLDGVRELRRAVTLLVPINQLRILCRSGRGGDRGILVGRGEGGWNGMGMLVSVIYEMMLFFGIDWYVALNGGQELELAGSQRVIEDEILFNECEFAAGNHLNMYADCHDDTDIG